MNYYMWVGLIVLASVVVFIATGANSGVVGDAGGHGHGGHGGGHGHDDHGHGH